MRMSFGRAPVVCGGDRTRKVTSGVMVRVGATLQIHALLRQTGASRKPHGDMTLNMEDDPDATGA